jgi:hypothetical protein
VNRDTVREATVVILSLLAVAAGLGVLIAVLTFAGTTVF